MNFNKIDFLSHLVTTYVDLGKVNGFTNNFDNSQISNKNATTKIEFGKWICLQHLVTIGTKGMIGEGYSRFSKGSAMTFLTSEIAKRTTMLTNELGTVIDTNTDMEKLTTEQVITFGAIQAMEELKEHLIRN